MKLAEALLLRKHLQNKVEVLSEVKNLPAVFERQVVRKAVTDSLDDVMVQTPRLSAGQFTQELDFYSHRLRVLDAAIQRTNWDTEMQAMSLDVTAEYKTTEDIGETTSTTTTTVPAAKRPASPARRT